MPNIQPISRARHARQRWCRPPNHLFASKDALVSLLVQELPRAVLSLPVGFVAVADGYLPVAVQGFEPGRNLFVAPDGRWIGNYVPSAYRGYPFMLGAGADGPQMLCIDEDSGLLVDDIDSVSPVGEAFFGDDNAPSESVVKVLGFLEQAAANRQATRRVCASLQQHGLIQPWRIKAQTEAGEQNIQGLFCIDEAALNQLPAEALLELRQQGALAVAYCQLLSMQHLSTVAELAKAHAQLANAQLASAAKAVIPPNAELDLEFLNKKDSISFGNLFSQ